MPYENLEMLSRGAVSGKISEWPLLKTEARKILDELQEYDQLFELQRTRMGEATEAWRKVHPGKELIAPDLGDLLTWLLAEIARLKDLNINLEALLNDQQDANLLLVEERRHAIAEYPENGLEISRKLTEESLRREAQGRQDAAADLKTAWVKNNPPAANRRPRKTPVTGRSP